MEKSNDILQESLKYIAKKQNYDNCQITIKYIASDGGNYSSYLYNVTLQSPGKKDLKMFAKVAAVGENIRILAPFFKKEHFFYNTLLGKYKVLEDKNNVPLEHRLITPKFYGASEEHLRETLILEDLTVKGFTQHDRLQAINWEYASKSLENLAKFHALSIALFEEEPRYFKDIDILKMKTEYSTVADMIKSAINTTLPVIREENRTIFKKYLESETLKMEKNPYDRIYRRPVITHGDYKPSNIMHRIVNGQLEVITLDFQMISIGNPIVDILYLIYLGSDKKFRDQHFKPCLEHYYEELCKALKRLGVDPQKVYSKEDFNFEVKEILPLGLIQSLCALPMITLDKDDAPALREDSTLDDLIVKPNALYIERINDVVDEFIEKGIITK